MTSDNYTQSIEALVTPPRSSLLEPQPLPTYISSSPSSRSGKRKASDDASASTQLALPKAKKSKTARSSSQPPPPRSNMADSQVATTPELDEDGMPVRYTPTTGRISKAKKGLPVHHCQYGCGKVYTRAEHRKRHEQNHRREALLKCTFSDCQKEFQRFDLFQRHLEKQHGQNVNLAERPRASSVESSIASASASEPRETMVMSSSGAPMPRGVTTPPYTATFPAFQMGQTEQTAWAESHQMQGSLDQTPAGLYSDIYADSLSSSPQATQFHHDRTRTMSAPPAGPPDQFAPSAVQTADASAAALWPAGTFWPDQSAATDTAGSFTAPYGVDVSSGTRHNVDVEYARSRAIAIPTMANSTGGSVVVELDAEHLQHYHQCYWSLFDSLFPIVHRPSYSPASPESALLGAMMVAIGAQYSVRACSAAHSLESYTLACSMIEQIDFGNTIQQAALSTWQGVVLWEYFSLYKGRVRGVHRSPNFVTLYKHLIDTADFTDAADSDSDLILGKNASAENAYQIWACDETRNRLLTACFIVDTYRSTLFHQASLWSLPPDSKMPRLCSAKLWIAATADEWSSLITNDKGTPETSSFQNAAENAINLHLQGRVNVDQPLRSLDISSWAVHLASSAPVRSLLAVANSRARVFQQSLSPSEWNLSRSRVQEWAASSKADTDAYYAGKILNMYFARQAVFDKSDVNIPGLGLEIEWVLHIAVLVFWGIITATATNLQVSRESLHVRPVAHGSATPLDVQTDFPPSVITPSPTIIQSPQSATSHMSVSAAVASPHAGLLPRQLLQSSSLLSSKPLSSAQAMAVAQRQMFGHAMAPPPLGQPTPLQEAGFLRFLENVDVADVSLLPQLRGFLGLAPVLAVVRNILAKDLPFKSDMIVEAVETLTDQLQNEEIRAMARSS